MSHLKFFFIQCFYYLFFHLIILGLHLVVLSFIAFFHFDLGHTLSVIDDWVYLGAWKIMLISKFVAGYTLYKLLIIKSNIRSPLRSILSRCNLSLSKMSLSISFFLLGSFFFLGEPSFELRSSFEFSKLLFSSLGIFFFCGIDFLVLFLLDNFYPLNFKQKLIRIFLFPIIFFIFSKSTYYMNQDNNLMIYFFSFVLLISYSISDYNWKNFIIVLTFLVLPLNSFFGLDLMWGNDFSLFVLNKPLSSLNIGVLCIILFLYFIKKSKVKGKIL